MTHVALRRARATGREAVDQQRPLRRRAPRGSRSPLSVRSRARARAARAVGAVELRRSRPLPLEALDAALLRAHEPVDDRDARASPSRDLDASRPRPRSGRRATAAARPGRAAGSRSRAPRGSGRTRAAAARCRTSGRLTRSPGAVNSTCSIRSRTCAASSARGGAPAAVDVEREVDVHHVPITRICVTTTDGGPLRDLLGALAEAAARLQDHRLPADAARAWRARATGPSRTAAACSAAP